MRIGDKDVKRRFVVACPAVVGNLLPDNQLGKKRAQDFVAKYDEAYGAGAAHQFAGPACDALTVLE